MQYKPDCRYFIGDVPCAPGKECRDCEDYHPWSSHVLIIKTGAGGDVLRTACLLPGLVKRYPDAKITWVTEKVYFPLLANNALIHRLRSLEWQSVFPLQFESFDILINLEKVQPCLALAEAIPAKKKYGFGMDDHGIVRPINALSMYAFHLGINDNLKFVSNRKTYPQIIYEMCDLQYTGQRYDLELNEKQQMESEHYRKQWKKEGYPLVGLNTGSGPVFAAKNWSTTRWINFITVLLKKDICLPVLLGGKAEEQKNHAIKKHFGERIIHAGTNHSLDTFIAIVSAMDALVTGDTLAMHIAIARNVPSVVLVGPTSAVELDVFGNGTILTTDFDCAPCYRKTCDKEPNCIDSIRNDLVCNALLANLHLQYYY